MTKLCHLFGVGNTKNEQNSTKMVLPVLIWDTFFSKYFRTVYLLIFLLLKTENIPFYCVSVDVKKCFDSIDQQKLMSVVSPLLIEHEYIIHRCAVVKRLGVSLFLSASWYL